MRITTALRREFDRTLETHLDKLPEPLRALIEEVPVIVEDRPSPALKRELRIDDDTSLCGLHDGVPLTQRSVEDSAMLPETITLFREGIIDLATDDHGRIDPNELSEQIRITLLHEIGHHFGLSDDDLAQWGYE